jgi:hypothetical protein
MLDRLRDTAYMTQAVRTLILRERATRFGLASADWEESCSTFELRPRGRKVDEIGGR